MTTAAPSIDGITFQVKQVTDNEHIYKAAVSFLLKRVSKEEIEKLPKIIDVTAWLRE